MGFLDYQRRPRIMVVANGHTFDRTSFMAMIEAKSEFEAFIVEHPIATEILSPALIGKVDAIVLYDMPGGNPWDGPDYAVDPDERYKANFLSLLDEGIAVVALHHAIAAWTTWPQYSEILGGKLLHFPMTVRGEPCADGGYRQDVTYEITALDTAHPVVSGLPHSFEIEDEIYLMEIFHDSIKPLLSSSFDYRAENCYSLALAMTGERRSNRGWTRNAGSNVVGWTKTYGNSAIAYIQPGHGPTAYENQTYRSLIHNAIQWAISETASLRAAAHMSSRETL